MKVRVGITLIAIGGAWPSPAFAHHCGEFGDCGGIIAAIGAAVGIALLVVGAGLLLPVLLGAIQSTIIGARALGVIANLMAGKGFFDALTGVDGFTGQKLTWLDRVMNLTPSGKASKIADEAAQAALRAERQTAAKLTGLTESKILEITALQKGARPNPTAYLDRAFIIRHLSKFDGGVSKFAAQAPLGRVGPPGGTFVMPKSVADDIVQQSGGNVKKLESLLGLSQGALGKNPVRINVIAPQNIRMPSGNEVGANAKWFPGGFTSGKIPEAVIESVPKGAYIVQDVFKVK